VRSRLVALVLCVVVPTLVVSVLAAVSAWESGRAATERDLTARADALASAVRRELDLSRATLQALATSPQLAANGLAGFHARLAAIPLSAGARIVLADEAGQILLHSLYPYGSPLPKRGDPGIAARIFAVGVPQVSDLFFGSRSSDGLIAVDVPVRIGGRVAYDLGIALHADALHRVLLEQRLPPAWSAALMDGRGTLLSRTIHPERAVGRPAPAASLAAIAAAEPLFSSVSQDGVPIRAAQAAVPDTGWSVLVAVPIARLEAPLKRTLLTAVVVNGGLLLTGLLAALWHARRIARPLGALSVAAAAVGRDAAPPPVPPGVREATTAAGALAAAAADLARRGRERDVAERRRVLLVAELNHRVKNTLATVQSLAEQTAKRADGDLGRFNRDFNGRLQALARAHDLLTASAWEGSTLGAVADRALAPWSGQGRLRVVDAGGANGPVGPHQALALVLALHELATNAAKHGALSRLGGRVEVRLAAEPDGRAFHLDWTEAGGPRLSGEPPQRQGFGMRLLQRGLAHDLGRGSAVRLRFDPAGLRAEIGFATVVGRTGGEEPAALVRAAVPA
jgi:two-component sensor histidine kinase